jgi:SAM-dependent methyltransferase
MFRRVTVAVMKPPAGSPWDAPSTVAGFATGEPNRVLMEYAARVLGGRRNAQAIDIGCGAGRNGIPLAVLGWRVLGTDLSLPMLTAAIARGAQSGSPAKTFGVAMASMDALPAADCTADLIVAHGIWNLATSGAEFRRALREAARVAREGAALFVFTFSRHTLPADASPVPGETFVFTQFSGRPQCFLTREQLVEELREVGFVPDSTVPFSEYNRPAPGSIRAVGGPVIYEAAFRFHGGV